MVKLLHLADVGLGARQYVATDALLERTRTAGRTAFRRAVGCALREQVDAVVVAGNLFDAHRLDYGTEQFLVRQLARLDEAGVPCFYAAGPADPGGPDTRGAEVGWPASLHRFDTLTPESVLLEDADGRPSARIVGAGLAHAADRDGVSDPPDAPFPEAKKAVPHVGVLHAPPRSPQRRTPQSALWKAMKKADYDYWALGGASHHQTVGKKERAWHAGPTAGRHPSEAGPQGGLLVTLEAGEKPQVAFRPFAPLCWADLVLDDLEDAATAHALLQRAQQAFAPVRGEGTRTAWLVRFTLTGSCPLASALRQEDDRARLEARLTQHLDIDAAFVRLRHLTPPAHPERHRDEPHVLSEVLALLDRAAEDRALLRELAPRELAAAPSEDPQEDYLYELIEALDREACARLLREPPSETPSETSSE